LECYFCSKILSMKEAKDCQSIQEIREVIDEIDYQILTSFALRNEYVEAIVKFKHDRHGIIAGERQKEVLHRRSKWAKEMGLDPEVIELIYKTLINSNIQKELEIFGNKEKTNI
jgi:isochorismate pyruvate lyase